LIQRYRRLIFSIPVGYRIPQSECDDIFQRVALKLFQHLKRIKRTESLPAWLIVTTRRECQSALRGKRRELPIEDLSAERLSEDPPDVTGRLDAVIAEHTLSLAVTRLDQGCRELLSALYLEDPKPSYQEISRRTGRPVGSLGPTRTRCLGKLKKLFERLGGEAP
jgi:RNA polymerase sigma factor (sigma-70 family)